MKRTYIMLLMFVIGVASFAQTELLTSRVTQITSIADFRWSEDMVGKSIQNGNAEEALYWMKQYKGPTPDHLYNEYIAYTYFSGWIIWEGTQPQGKTTYRIRVGNALSNLHIAKDWQLSIQYFKKLLKFRTNWEPLKREYCLKIGVMYELGGNGVTQDIAEAKKWYKKGMSFTESKDESFLLCEKSLARVEQKGTMLASSSASKPKSAKEEKPAKVVETPKPNKDVAVVEKPQPKVEQKVEQNPSVPKKEIFPVDVSIPSNSQKGDYTYVLIIANENYQDVENVKFALNDGRIFKEYCEKTLGIPASNIRIKEDATLNNIISGIDWLQSICEASNGKGKCIVYYSGHGIPDESTQNSYILPVDGSGKNIRTGYSLNELYSTLSNLPVESATMFIDACFSGANRGNNMLVAARGVAIKAKPEEPKGKLVVFSAAQSDETAFPYEDAKHGMFTYYLLRKLKESKGNCSLAELSDYLKENVTRTALLENDKPQTPATSVSPLMESVWREIKLK